MSGCFFLKQGVVITHKQIAMAATAKQVIIGPAFFIKIAFISPVYKIQPTEGFQIDR